MLRQLIVNADDFGYTPGVSQGIIQAHREGIVTSTSVMINMPSAAEWVVRAKAEAPQIGLGLHLTLTAGPPASPPDEVPALLRPDGTFRRQSDLVASLPTVNLEQVERELRAQIARFTEIVGHPPDHLDSHHHVTYFSPPLAALMFRLAQELDVPIRRAFPGGPDEFDRAADFMIGATVGTPGRAFAEEMVEVIHGLEKQSAVRMPDYFVTEFYDQGATLGDLLLILVHLPEGVTELMCHPAVVDVALRNTSSYTDRRADELKWLTHESTREVIRTEFIQLITFTDLKN